jgi:hypothetical protein
VLDDAESRQVGGEVAGQVVEAELVRLGERAGQRHAPTLRRHSTIPSGSAVSRLAHQPSAGTVASGVDPTTQTFGLSALGWFLVLLPIIGLVLGVVVGQLRRNDENADAVADLVS